MERLVTTSRGVFVQCKEGDRVRYAGGRDLDFDALRRAHTLELPAQPTSDEGLWDVAPYSNVLVLEGEDECRLVDRATERVLVTFRSWPNAAARSTLYGYRDETLFTSAGVARFDGDSLEMVHRCDKKDAVWREDYRVACVEGKLARWDGRQLAPARGGPCPRTRNVREWTSDWLVEHDCGRLILRGRKEGSLVCVEPSLKLYQRNVDVWWEDGRVKLRDWGGRRAMLRH